MCLTARRRASSGKQELQLGANGPARAEAWMLHVVEGLEGRVERLTFNLKDLPDPAAQREVPSLAAIGTPIRRDHRRAYQLPPVRHVVIDEGLQQGLVNIFAPLRAGDREQLAGEEAYDPGFWHHQPDRTRTDAELA
jgi:hypothetical protein